YDIRNVHYTERSITLKQGGRAHSPVLSSIRFKCSATSRSIYYPAFVFDVSPEDDYTIEFDLEFFDSGRLWELEGAENSNKEGLTGLTLSSKTTDDPFFKKDTTNQP
ncbi:MAG: hypothetical protein AAF226_02330, partial [Verrucomicrobiota bacterium]